MLIAKAHLCVDIFCKKVFGHGLTKNIQEFVGHLSWSFFGGIFAAAILLLTNILAGRWLGVEEYGKYAVVFATAQIFLIVFLMGMDLSIARKIVNAEEKEKKADISASFVIVFISISMVGITYLLTKDKVASFFQIDASLLSVAFIFGVILAFRQISESVVRGLHWFKIQAFTRIIEAITVFCSFFLLTQILHNYIYTSLAQSLWIGSTVLIAIYLIYLRYSFRRFGTENIRSLLKYGKIAFLASFFGIIFVTLDKVAIARYLDFTQLGIYSAYFTASFILVSQLGALIDNVLFPTIARFKDNITSLIMKIDQLTIALFLPFYLGMLMVISIIIYLFGPQYPFNWYHVLTFSLLATLKMILIINTSLITAYSTRSLKLGVVYGNITNILFVLIFLLYIQFFALTISAMVLYLCLYTFLFIILNKAILFKVGLYKRI